jgi:conjugal transfer/entry exclusion protein
VTERHPNRDVVVMQMAQEFISRLIQEIDDIKARIDAQTTVLENSPEQRLREEQAKLRNLSMKLDGLQLLLRKTEEQSHGG